MIEAAVSCGLPKHEINSPGDSQSRALFSTAPYRRHSKEFRLSWAPIEEIRPGDMIWFAWREALAWSNTYDRYDTRRHPGGVGWYDRRLDGARQRRAIPEMNSRLHLAPKSASLETELLLQSSGFATPRARSTALRAWRVRSGAAGRSRLLRMT
jgi:hypothetical protein